MGTPEFFAGIVPTTDPTRYTWAGAYPYIDTADEDGSYGEVNTVGLGVDYDKYVGSTLPAYTAPAGITSARVDYQIHIAALDALHRGSLWWMRCGDVTAPWNFSHSIPSVVGWNTFADTYVFDPTSGPSYDLPAMLAALATGSMRLAAVQARQDVIFRVSQLRLTLISSVAPPLRQVQRDDGLGRSVMRARGTRSVQKSIRQRGYR
jgi:hypothetical protein